jgi:hypothetical protein
MQLFNYNECLHGVKTVTYFSMFRKLISQVISGGFTRRSRWLVLHISKLPCMLVQANVLQMSKISRLRSGFDVRYDLFYSDTTTFSFPGCLYIDNPGWAEQEIV